MNHAAAVTPSDTQNLPAGSEYLSFNNTGTQTIQITTVGGELITLTGMLGGIMHPLHATRVWNAGTTVTNIVTYWT